MAVHPLHHGQKRGTSTKTTQEIQETILGAIQNKCLKRMAGSIMFPLMGPMRGRSWRHFNLKLDLPELVPCQRPRHVQTATAEEHIATTICVQCQRPQLECNIHPTDTKSHVLCIVAKLGMTPTRFICTTLVSSKSDERERIHDFQCNTRIGG